MYRSSRLRYVLTDLGSGLIELKEDCWSMAEVYALLSANLVTHVLVCVQ